MKKCTYGKRFKGRIIGCCEKVFLQSNSLIGDNRASPAKVYQNCPWKACHNKTLFSLQSPLVKKTKPQNNKTKKLSYRDKQIG